MILLESHPNFVGGSEEGVEGERVVSGGPGMILILRGRKVWGEEGEGGGYQWLWPLLVWRTWMVTMDHALALKRKQNCHHGKNYRVTTLQMLLKNALHTLS